MDEQQAQVEYDEPVAAAGRPRRPLRTRGILAVVASGLLMAGALVGSFWLLTDGDRAPSPAPSSGTSVSSDAVADGPLGVSGTGVGAHPFGTDADQVVADVTALLGDPDLAAEPRRYHRIRGSDGWFEDGDDPISPSWRYPVAATTCWDRLCLVLGGNDVDALELRGWELTEHGDRSGEEVQDREVPDVRLAGSGIRLGDSWERLHAAYPDTIVAGAEGASLAVGRTPWAGIFDGAAEWRLSGQWDHTRPHQSPPGAAVTRLSGGEGPEPGCC